MRKKHDFNLISDGRLFRFWCEKLWKQVYICQGNEEAFHLYEHNGLSYSIFRNDGQIAAFTKNRVVLGHGNRYEIRMDSDADLILILCMVLTINSEEGSDNSQSVTIDFGNIGPEDRPFDSTWEPR